MLRKKIPGKRRIHVCFFDRFLSRQAFLFPLDLVDHGIHGYIKTFLK